MKKLSLFAAALSLAFTLNGSAQAKDAHDCTYSGDPKDVQVVWTAFKTTAKTPVKGHFQQTKLEGNTSSPSLSALLRGLQIEIDGATVETDNPARNATLQQFFFEKFVASPKIAASVVKVEGDEQKGQLTLKIRMNGTARQTLLSYTVNPEGVFEAKGSIDMMNFRLQAPFDSLHSACENLHKGSDGVSKTWTQVDLSVTGKLKKSCH